MDSPYSSYSKDLSLKFNGKNGIDLDYIGFKDYHYEKSDLSSYVMKNCTAAQTLFCLLTKDPIAVGKLVLP